MPTTLCTSCLVVGTGMLQIPATLSGSGLTPCCVGFSPKYVNSVTPNRHFFSFSLGPERLTVANALFSRARALLLFVPRRICHPWRLWFLSHSRTVAESWRGIFLLRSWSHLEVFWRSISRTYLAEFGRTLVMRPFWCSTLHLPSHWGFQTCVASGSVLFWCIHWGPMDLDTVLGHRWASPLSPLAAPNPLVFRLWPAPLSEPVCQALSSTSTSETAGLSSPDTQRVHSFAADVSCMSLPNSLVPWRYPGTLSLFLHLSGPHFL